VVCVDEFGPLNLQPRKGKAWRPQRQPRRQRATYTRTSGVMHMLAALDLTTGKLLYRIKDRKRWIEFLDLPRRGTTRLLIPKTSESTVERQIQGGAGGWLTEVGGGWGGCGDGDRARLGDRRGRGSSGGGTGAPGFAEGRQRGCEVRGAGPAFGRSTGGEPGISVLHPPIEPGEEFRVTVHLRGHMWSGHRRVMLPLKLTATSRETPERTWIRRIQVPLVPEPPSPIGVPTPPEDRLPKNPGDLVAAPRHDADRLPVVTDTGSGGAPIPQPDQVRKLSPEEIERGLLLTFDRAARLRDQICHYDGSPEQGEPTTSTHAQAGTQTGPMPRPASAVSASASGIPPAVACCAQVQLQTATHLPAGLGSYNAKLGAPPR
jgi:hypothetical protein